MTFSSFIKIKHEVATKMATECVHKVMYNRSKVTEAIEEKKDMY